MKALRPLSDRVEIRMPSALAWGGWTFVRHWGRFRVTMFDRRVTVEKLGRPWPAVEWVETFAPVRLTRLDLNWSESVGSKWIKAAVGRKAKSKAGALPGEPVLCEGRPALADFLCETEGASGGVREPSVLMIGLTADGVRVGLKDEDAGGWCWRVGVTLAAALDAIEKALTGDEPAFRQGRQQTAKKRR